ncbi:MAG: tRNA-specific adenosine deaminase [Gammaproteobacteria bacterium]|jgi:tRNA(adenine34) deaminase|nr:tRNA-specific adenosine deaminase [Gammaproteobacteria bacterium]
MMNDEYWMQQALKLAQKAAEVGEVPIGAILLDENQTAIAQAHNHPIYLNDPTAHAEILVLRQAAQVKQNYRLPGTTLYCTLEPCAMCAGALIQARVDRIVFGAFDARSGALVSVCQLLNHPSLNHHAKVVGGICEQESVKLLQNFFKQRR